MIAVSFTSVVKDLSSAIPVMSELQTGSPNEEVKENLAIQNASNSRDCILFLVEAICILSLSSPMFPNEVSRLTL